ncbi:INO80 complex subunit B [Cylas formicarius]|uniref:INO80 complex subunit B n=1 Tax=Cylas formicarius TaxID=197179 RepID=UPI002958AB24|nr:INO80 complex subunit B [Cylas formicarius]XP_060536016.1 INO80 complex subunit B [Cylas formicarius]
MDPDENTTKKTTCNNKKGKSKKNKMAATDEESIPNELLIVDENSSGSKSAKVPISKPTSSTGVTNNLNKKRKKRDSGSSDEERWLTAIESGKLEDVDDELKKIKRKDPALMTARQRAMYDRGVDGNTSTTLMSLPTGYKEKVMTAEAIQKAAIKSLKRKQLADEKREKDKKKTMERLLKKQDSKAAKQAKTKVIRSSIPTLLYKQSLKSTILAVPIGVDYPIISQVAPELKKIVFCTMNCGNVKKYCCSKTGAPLCSFECYKKNISSRVI